MPDNVDIWLWLTMVMKPNNPRLGKILAECGFNAAKAGVVIRDGREPSLTAGEISRAKAIRLGTVREFAAFCGKSGVSIISYESENYPENLRKIENPPAVLFVLGSAEGLNSAPLLTVVGTRNVSDYGAAVTDYLVKPLAKAGAVIVSGMALGTDRAAHNACLDVGGRTLAFPGCGVLETHPSENTELKTKILENGGAVISELLPNERASSWYFKRRDAVMAGVSHATLVIEAGEKSGSLVTAECAKQQGKTVFAVPPRDIISGSFSGNAALIRSGAVSVFDFSDIASVLENKSKSADFAEKLRNSVNFAADKKEREKISEQPAASKKSSKRRKNAKIPEEQNAAENVEAQSAAKVLDEAALSAMSDTEKLIARALAESPDTTESVMEKLGLDYGAAIEALLSLEISGFLVRGNDGVYRVK
ncbi:MAG: DNA-processing protein DprA [[Eubacterium] saphenum]|nr:DNA-processing protein DprA [[Eubacterium] saphenum]